LVTFFCRTQTSMASASEDPYEAEEHAVNEAEDHAVSHTDRNNEYSDFQFRHNWITEKGQVENFLCACPLRERCNCKCEHGKVAISGNNQGVESNHLWDREARSHGRQVSRQCCQFIIH
jgi:hypothetical protein